MQEASRPAGTYLSALRAHRRLAIGVLLLTVIASVAYLALRSESYETSAEVLVTPLSAEQQNLLGLPLITESSNSTKVSQTAAALLHNNRAATAAAKSMGPGWDSNRVSSAIQIQPLGESNLIALTATADSPQLAARLANAYTTAALSIQNEDLRKRIKEVTGSLEQEIESGLSSTEQSVLEGRVAALRILERTGNPTLSLSQQAIRPDASALPSKKLVLIAALLGGAILGFVAALVIGALDTKVRSREEVEKQLPIPTLAEIPRSGRRASPMRATQAYRSLATEIEESGKKLRVLLVTAGSELEKKTQSAADLAAAARDTGQSVIFLDFDMHRDKASSDSSREIFGLSRNDPSLPRLGPDKSLAEVLIHPTNDPYLRVGLAPPPQQESDVIGLSRQMPRLISEARADGSLVIVDSPPLGEIGVAVRLVSHVDLILVVVQVGVSQRAKLDSLRDLLGRVGESSSGLVLLHD